MRVDGPWCAEFAARADVQYYGGQVVLPLQSQAMAGTAWHR